MQPDKTAVESALAVRKVRPAYQQVAEQLRALILSGEIKPGARLPVESELAAMFGVSRSTIREALRVLSSQNLVVTSRGVGGGSFVAHPEPEYVSDFLEASFGLLSGADTISVDELLEVRETLEVPATRLAAKRRTDHHLTIMRSCLADDASDVDRAHLFEGNHLFHATILEASGNRLLSVVTRPVFSVLRTRILRDRAPARFWKHVAADHAELLALIEKGDGDAAAECMQAHLERLRPTYQQIERKDKT